eukprot:1446433-Rhodomonas_salina.1
MTTAATATRRVTTPYLLVVVPGTRGATTGTTTRRNSIWGATRLAICTGMQMKLYRNENVKRAFAAVLMKQCAIGSVGATGPGIPGCKIAGVLRHACTRLSLIIIKTSPGTNVFYMGGGGPS